MNRYRRNNNNHSSGGAFNLSNRPRAPSPPRSEDEDDSDEILSDNTYSIVQDSVIGKRRPPPPPKATSKTTSTTSRLASIHKASAGSSRRFGDSVNPSPAESVVSSSSASSSNSGGGGKKSSNKYDAATVEEIKAQFQKQIETMLMSQERNNNSSGGGNVSNKVTAGHIMSASEKELDGIRDLQRGKSFLEARSAVQRQIERMFSDANNANSGADNKTKSSSDLSMIKHTMHGVSHALPGEDDEIKPPPPVHYGVDQALKARWQSVESLEDPNAAENKKNSGRQFAEANRFNKSSENVSSSGKRLNVSAEIHNDDDEDDEVDNVTNDIAADDVVERMRRFKMEKGKSTPNLSIRGKNGALLS